ncbi:hypothetical protein [Beauveria bassiana polymycovirus 4]|nr:hypothetical protein [Beauveria bassiana polymycovirus 4]
MSEVSSFVLPGAHGADPRVSQWADDTGAVRFGGEERGATRPVIYPPTRPASVASGMTRRRERAPRLPTVVDSESEEEEVNPEDADPVPPYMSRADLAPADSVSHSGRRRRGSADETLSSVSLSDSTVDRLARRLSDLNTGPRPGRREAVPTVDEAVATTARHRRRRLAPIEERPTVRVLASLVFGTGDVVYDSKRHVLRSKK